MLEKQTKIWNKFYGGTSSDDKLSTGKQVVFSEGIDLKTHSDFASIGHNSEQKISTGGKIILGFIEVTGATGATKVFGYGEDGVVYDIENGTNDTPNYTQVAEENYFNGVEFNGNIYLLHGNTSPIGTICTKIPSAEMYAGDFSNAEEYALTDGTKTLNSNIKNQYGVYNASADRLYIASGSEIYVEDVDGNNSITTIAEGNIIDITKRGATIRLHQDNGKITNYNGSIIDPQISSISEIGFPLAGAITHLGTDFLIGMNGELGYMDGYQYMPISQPIESELIGRKKFTFLSFFNGMLSLGGQLYIIDTNNNTSTDYSIVSFGNAKTGFPKCFEYLLRKAPNGTNVEIIAALGKVANNDGFYFSYKYGTTNGVAYFDLQNNTTVQNNGTMYLDLFDGGAKTSEKKIEEIQVYTRDTDISNTVTINANIDGGGYTELKTISDSGRYIFNPDNSFFDISFKIDLVGDAKFYEIKLIYSIID